MSHNVRSGTVGGSVASRLRMVPLLVATVPPGGHRYDTAAVEVDHRRIAEEVVAMCGRVLSGASPMTGLKDRCDLTARQQLARMQRRLSVHGESGGVRLTTVRSSRQAEMVDIVAMLRLGDSRRALALRVGLSSPSRWRLLLCDLV